MTRVLLAAALVTLALTALAGLAAPAADAATTDLQAEAMSLPASAGQVFSDSTASGGQALLIWSNASASASVATAGATRLVVSARGDQCAGAPHMVVAVDGKTVLSQDVPATGWADYGAPLQVADGTHSLTVAFTNDYMASGCDRNLRVDRLRFVAPASSLEAETMSLPSSGGQVFSDSSASGGQAQLIWSNATASATVDTPSAQQLSIVARGDQCAGAPHMVVTVDGSASLSQDVPASGWTTYSAQTAIAAGSHSVSVAFTNDYMGSGCDRNLRVDKIVFSGTAATGGTTSGDPFAGATWFIDPQSNAKQQADAWRSSRPADAAQMDKIAGQPQADWFGDWSGDVQSAVASRVAQIANAKALPVLVAYDIPLRDCGSYSSGGATSASAYQSWIRAFAAGIGSHQAAVILEPDALAGMDCLSQSDQQTRLSLLSDAVNVLAGHSGIAVYIDAGNSRWQSAGTMASRLQSANIAKARGFSLNVSNYLATSEETGYGDQLAKLVGGKHFVVDTSRNGLGPTADNQWCNAPGRALGDRPTAATGDAAADAYLWIKRPGESDGTCNGGPAAGAWWADYALGLAQRAAY